MTVLALPAPSRRPRTPTFRPQVEGLEDRWCPASFTVTSTADAGTGGGTARPGVYVLTTDFLGISLNAEQVPAGTGSGDAASKSRCGLVLKRERAK